MYATIYIYISIIWYCNVLVINHFFSLGCTSFDLTTLGPLQWQTNVPEPHLALGLATVLLLESPPQIATLLILSWHAIWSF